MLKHKHAGLSEAEGIGLGLGGGWQNKEAGAISCSHYLACETDAFASLMYMSTNANHRGSSKKAPLTAWRTASGVEEPITQTSGSVLNPLPC